jgi:hypothetical protein
MRPGVSSQVVDSIIFSCFIFLNLLWLLLPVQYQKLYYFRFFSFLHRRGDLPHQFALFTNVGTGAMHPCGLLFRQIAAPSHLFAAFARRRCALTLRRGVLPHARG